MLKTTKSIIPGTVKIGKIPVRTVTDYDDILATLTQSSTAIKTQPSINILTKQQTDDLLDRDTPAQPSIPFPQVITCRGLGGRACYWGSRKQDDGTYTRFPMYCDKHSDARLVWNRYYRDRCYRAAPY